MKNILIYGDNKLELLETQSVLEANLPYHCTKASSEAELWELLDMKNFKLVIMEGRNFGQEGQLLVRSIMDKGYSIPALVVAREVASPLFFEDKTKNKAHWLPKPYFEKDLLGLTRKLIHTNRIPQQRHKRFRTNQPAFVEAIVTGDTIDSQMYNLSKGGAYCELGKEDKPLSKGDLLRIKIKLNDVERAHTLNARVVWTTEKGSFSGRSGIGMKFVKPEDIHRFLMDKIY